MKSIIASLFFLFITFNIFAQNSHKGLKLYGETKKSFGETEWIKKMCDGGLYLHIGAAIPGKQSYIPLGIENNSDEKFGLGPHFEFGNMILINEFNDNSIGLRATWLSVMYTKWSNSDVDASYLHASPVRLGPYVTIELADEIGLDLFYQIGASYAYDFNIDTSATGRDYLGYWGFTHNTGAGVRYQMYSFGIDYNFGNIKYTDKVEYKDLSDEFVNDFFKINTGYLRIYAGFRF